MPSSRKTLAPAAMPHPALLVPILYLLQAMPVTLVREVSTLIYKDLGLSNGRIALGASLLGIPWSLKFFWGPLVELTSTRRTWVFAGQSAVLAGLIGGALSLQFLSGAWQVGVFSGFLVLTALASATHDIALDGLYIQALNPTQQARFQGLQTASFRLGRLACIGGLVYGVGKLSGKLSDLGGSGDPAAHWTWAWLLAGGVYLCGSLTARRLLPAYCGGPAAEASRPAAESSGHFRRLFFLLLLGASLYGLLSGGLSLLGHGFSILTHWPLWRCSESQLRQSLLILLISALAGPLLFWKVRAALRSTPMGEAFGSFLGQPGIYSILAFILFYRLSEAMVSQMSPLFMRDPIERGGLGLSLEAIGKIHGIGGVAGIILGGICGGLVIGRWGLKKSFWPLVFSMHLPNLLYLWAASARPPLWSIYGLDFFDQFGYGFGFAGYSVYLMHMARRSAYPTTWYAIATGLGALCLVLAGILSGILQEALGYRGLFVGVCLAALPGMMTLLWIPMESPPSTGET